MGEQEMNREMQAIGESQQKIKKKNKKRQTNILENKDVDPGDEEDISSGKKISIVTAAVFGLKTDAEKVHFVSELVCPSQERKRKKQMKRQGNALVKNYVNPFGQEDSSSSKKPVNALENKDADPGGEEDISSNKEPFITEAGINVGPKSDSEKFHLDSESICPSEERRRKKWKKKQGSALGNNDVNHSGQEFISSIKTISLDTDLKTLSEKAHVEPELILPTEERKREKKKKRQGNSLGDSDIYKGTQKDVSSTNPTPFVTEPVINTGPTTVSEMAHCGLESCLQEEKKKRKKQKKKKGQGNAAENNDMNHCDEEDTSSIKITSPATEEAVIDIGLKSGSEKAHLDTEFIHPEEERKIKKQKKRRGKALGNEDVNHGGQDDASSIQTTSHVTDDEINIGPEMGTETAHLPFCHPSGEKTGKKRKKRHGNSMNHGAQGGASSIKINLHATENTGPNSDLEMIHLDSESSHLDEERKKKKGKKRKGNALGNNEIDHVTRKYTSLIDTASLVKEDLIDIGSELSNPPKERTGKKQKKRQENAPGDNDMNHYNKEDPSLVNITPLVMEDSVGTSRQNDSEMGHPELSHPPGGGKRKKRKKKSCSALKNDDKENVLHEENSTRKDAVPVDLYSHKPVLECSEPEISELNASLSLCTEKNEGEPWCNRHDSSKNNEANFDNENDGKPVLKVAGFDSTSVKENSLISHEVGFPKHLNSSQQDFDAKVDQNLPDTQKVETNQRKKNTTKTSHSERGMSSNFSVNGLKATEEQDLVQTSQDHSYREHVAVIKEIKLDVILEGGYATSAKISDNILQKKYTANGSNGEVTSKEVADRMEMNPEDAIGGDSMMEDVSVSNIYKECIEEKNNGDLAEVLISVENKHEKDDSCNKCPIDCKRSCDNLAGHDFSCAPMQKSAEKETKIEESSPSLSILDVTKNSGDPNDAEKQSNIPQNLHSLSEKPRANHSRKKLLVLDLNGLLADIVPYIPYGYRPHARVSGKSVFKRPFCEDFLAFCFKRFDIGIWSSRLKKNVDSLVHILFGDSQHKLLFCWDASHCTRTGFQTIENKDKPLVLKELKILWEYLGHAPSSVNQEYNESNTLLVDDSPYKALRNPAHTAIFPYSYKYKDVRDSSLGPKGDLRLYLGRLAVAENVQKFVEQSPFGQQAISESDPSWDFYSKILSTS